MAQITKQWNAIFSSDPSTGAINVSPDGSSFKVAFPGGIRIPREAQSCDIGVLSASVWNDSNNISAAFNNNTFVFTTTGPGAGTYTLTVPDGLYSLDALNSFLALSFTNLGMSAGLMQFTGDSATSKCVLTFLLLGDSVNFTLSGIAPVVGFQGMGVITAPAVNYSIYGNSVAAFNRVNSYLITSDIVQSGIPTNSNSSQVIVAVPITVQPGSQINFEPSIITWSDGSHLIGQIISNLSFQLRDQSLRPASTKEIWSVILTISYVVPVDTNTSRPASRW